MTEQGKLNKWIEDWLKNRLGEGNVFEQFNRQFCYDLIRDYIKVYIPELARKAGYVKPPKKIRLYPTGLERFDEGTFRD